MAPHFARCQASRYKKKMELSSHRRYAKDDGKPCAKRQRKKKDVKKTNNGSPASAELETVEQKCFGIFLLHGLGYVSNEDLINAISIVSSPSKHAAEREATPRCRKQHPSLFQVAVTAANNGGNNISLVDQWRQFERDEESRIISPSTNMSTAWPATIEEAVNDIDVLFELRKGDELVYHGVAPLEPDDTFSDTGRFDLLVFFQLPHWSFEAPLPMENESSSVSDTDNSAYADFFSSEGGEDWTLEQITLCKVLFGAPMHVRVAFRRRSNGRIVTVISSTRPDTLYGAGAHVGPGEFYLPYLNKCPLGVHDSSRLYAQASIDFFCIPLSEEQDLEAMKSITYSTYHHVYVSRHNLVEFQFGIDDAQVGDNLWDMFLAAMRTWFQE